MLSTDLEPAACYLVEGKVGAIYSLLSRYVLSNHLELVNDQFDMDDSVSSERSLLWALPEEMIEVVFDQAFQREIITKFVFQSNWELRERSKEDADSGNYISQPFQRREVDEFMVSKRFFLAAARAWFGSSFWEDTYRTICTKTVYDLLDAGNGLFLQFVRNIRSSYLDQFETIGKPVGLHDLAILVTGSTFNGVN